MITIYILDLIVISLLIAVIVSHKKRKEEYIEPMKVIQSKRVNNVEKFNKWVEYHQKQNKTFISINKQFEI